jgi:predicted dehydrogenase
MSIRFGVIGLTHNHVYGLTDQLLDAGAELVSVFSDEREDLNEYISRYPQVSRADSAVSILEDDSIQLIVGIPMPDERPGLGIWAMQNGKDYVCDKPGFTTLEQVADVRKICAETGRKYIVFFSERLSNPATIKAGELVQAGAIGRVIHTVGLGPHHMRPEQRPEWFFQKKHFGGILNDIACHQVDQFLYFTGSTSAEIVSSHVANYNHPQYAEIEDFGDITIRSDNATGYVRVDWFTPEGLGAWGDVRLFLLGTEGYIELRKIIDVQGRPGGNHLLLVNQEGQQYIDCSEIDTSIGDQLIQDILNRTENLMTQEHCLLASELTLQAQAMAHRMA